MWYVFGFLVLLFIILMLFAISSFRFHKQYRDDVNEALRTAGKTSMLTLADLEHLPPPVKKYIIYTGSVGKPKVDHFFIEFSGQLRKNARSPWMPFISKQYNFINLAERLFFLKATMNHLPVSGYHRYINGEAIMDIRLFSLVRVQYQSGQEMNISETVTFFNDMCCMAPATLIDKRIEWGAVKGNSVEAKFSIHHISITATLYFNDEGQLVNFISNDRYAVQDDGTMKRMPWTTPLRKYKEINGYRLASAAEAIYLLPDGKLIYGNFHLLRIYYNAK